MATIGPWLCDRGQGDYRTVVVSDEDRDGDYRTVLVSG